MTAFHDRLASLRNARAVRGEVRELIERGSVAVLHPLAAPAESGLALEVAEDVVADFISVFETMRSPRPGLVLFGRPLALLELPEAYDAYLERVGPKTRNVIRKAAKLGYEFGEFSWNERLDEIYAVNTSAERRSAGEMRGWYTEPVEPREEAAPELRKYYGAFKDDRLYGYLHLVVCGDFAFFRHFLGHKDHLAGGIMNGLIAWTVERHAGDPRLEWLNYGALLRQETSMNAFKRHAGFMPHAAFLDREGLRLPL